MLTADIAPFAPPPGADGLGTQPRRNQAKTEPALSTASARTLKCGARCLQVKVAEHVLTGHKVAIKILNRRKIKQMDMDEKGARRSSSTVPSRDHLL